MKKLSIIICTLLCFVLFLCSCDSKEPIDDPLDDIVEYTVTFHVDSDDITTKEIKYESGTNLTLELIEKDVFNNTTPSKNGYIAEDWYTDNQYTTPVVFPLIVNKNMNIYLNWIEEIIKYKLTYYVDGEVYKEFEFEENSKFSKITNPTKENYIFDGWYTNEFSMQKYTFNSNIITEDLNLYGYFIENPTSNHIEVYELLYCINEKIYYTDYILEGNFANKISDPILDGYYFDGWYTDFTFTTKFNYNEIVDETLILYAKFVKIETLIYKVNYYVDGFLYQTDILEENNTYQCGITLPSRRGYKFISWYTDNQYTTLHNNTDKITSDINLYGKYEKLELFTVEFYFENELFNTQQVYDGEFVNEPIVPSVDNKICDKWYKNSNYIDEIDLSQPITSDLKLYSRYVVFDLSVASDNVKKNLSAGGYVYDKLPDFTVYENTSAYRKVTTVEELVNAIKAAKYTYTTIFYYDGRNDEEKAIADRLAELDYINRTSALTSAEKTERTTLEAQALALGMPGHIEQELVSEGTVHVIEIMNDLNLGYYTLSQAAKDSGVISDFVGKQTASLTNFLMSDMFNENGMSQIQISNTTNLLIYSKNGAKLTHGGFQILSSHNIVIRNLEFDELWQWEDASTTSTSGVGNYDAFGWAYFKISFSGYVWIDHCTFGKSYDGQIDYSNPIYNVKSTSFRAPYGTDGVSNGLHISWCNFNAGSDDQNGYIYKMMDKIEKAYIAGTSNYLYYNKLRTSGADFEEILYGLATPQKKGFLLGDNGPEDQKYNYALNVSFANCKFINLEDRLPKLRGGNCYMYNCIIDCSEYFKYRQALKYLNINNLMTSYVSTWKCGLVSQGLIISQSGSVKAENCIFKGIDSLIKNNDEGKGGYDLVNCIYENTYYNSDGSTDTTKSFTYYGSSSDVNNKFTIVGLVSPEYFKWNTKDELQPFNIAEISIYSLNNFLNDVNYYSGVNTKLQNRFIICYY